MRPHPRPLRARQIIAFSASLLLLVSFLCADRQPALAFKPTSALRVTPNDKTHAQLTAEAIRNIISNGALIPGVTRPNTTMNRAIDDIIWGNAGADIREFFEDRAHFTGETFAGSKERLMIYRSIVVRSLIRGEVMTARIALGRALHLVQDFYAHSNWIENGNLTPHPTMTSFGSRWSNLASRWEATCEDCGPPDTCQFCRFNITTPRLTTAYFQPFSTTLFPNKPFGKCSHGGSDLAFGTIRPDRSVDFPATGGGINKDTRDCTESPHELWHVGAADLARQHTEQFLMQIRGLVTQAQFENLLGVNRALGFVIDTTGSMQGTIDNVKTTVGDLLDTWTKARTAPATLVLVELNDPRTEVKAVTRDPDIMINEIRSLFADGGGDCPEPAFAAIIKGLERLDNGGRLSVWTDANSSDGALLLDTAIDLAKRKNITVDVIATDDCEGVPDDFFESLTAHTGGQVFYVNANEGVLLAGLWELGIGPSMTDLAYYRRMLSDDSMLIPIPLGALPRASFILTGVSAASVLLRRPDGVTVLPTDPGVSFLSDASGLMISVENPVAGLWHVLVDGGSALAARAARKAAPAAREAARATGAGQRSTAAPGEARRTVRTSRSVTKAAARRTPRAITAGPEFTLRVTGESELDVQSFKFLLASGEPPHNGLMPIAGAPIAGQTYPVQAEVPAAEVANAQFEFRTAAGDLLQTLTLTEAPADGGVEVKRYVGTATVPTVPFMVYLTGTDPAGGPVQRLLPGLVSPQTLKLDAPETHNMLAGQPTTLTLSVTNAGPAGTFELIGSDDLGYISTLTPATVTLGTNQTANFTATLLPPATAVIGTSDPLNFTVRSVANPDVANEVSVLGLVSDEAIWIEDALPTGAVPESAGESWQWAQGPYSGQLAHESSPAAGLHKHGFTGATDTLAVNAGDHLFTYVYLDPADLPAELMLEFHDGTSWEHRAYWGADNINLGQSGTASRHYMGPIQTSEDGWVRLEVPAAALGLEGSVVSGISFTLDGGRAAWDRTGKRVPSNKPPAVGITSPASGISPSEPADINIRADASDEDGTVSSVEFYEGTNLLGTVTARDADNLYTFAWNDVPAGSYVIRAKAVDNGGQATSSEPVAVTVNAAPTVSITSPADGSLYAPPASFVIDATAADTNFGIINKVEFFQNGVKVGEDTTAPYGVTLTGVPVGAYALTAVVTDDTGVSITSAPVNVNVATGRIYGRVTNADGTAPLGGATVRAIQGTRTLTTATSNAAGEYALEILPDGEYTVEASALMYITQARAGVVVAGGGGTAADFNLEPLPPPAITGFSPAIGNVGAAVTITGANFDTTLVNNEVKFNTTRAVVSAVTPTSISTSVPAATASGRVTVTTPTGTAVGSADFYVPPWPYTPADVEYTGRTTIGSTASVAVGTANKVGLLLFDGAAGQRLSLNLSAVAFGTSGAGITIYKPDGTTLAATSVGTSGGFIDAMTLPAAGTYTILVDPQSTGTGSITLKLNEVPPDVSGTITPGGAPASVATTAPGQNARFTFQGTAGQRVSLKITGVNITGGNGYAYIHLKKPDDTTLAYDFSDSGGFVDTQTLPASGTYSVFVDPVGTGVVGAMTLTLYDVPADATGSISAFGTPSTIATTVPGQNALVSFNGAAGQRVTLNIGGVNLTGGNGYVDVHLRKPDGTALGSAAYVSSGGGFVNTQTLATAGVYNIFINPQGSNTGSLTLTLNDVSADVTGSVTPGGSPVTVTTTTAGQNALLTFDGTSGQRVSLKVTGVSLTGGNGYVDVSIKKPDGTTLVSSTYISSGGGFVEVQTLPVTGTYTVLVDPQGSNKGSVTLTLYDVPPDVSGPLAPGGAPVTVSMGTPGQNARLTFQGTAGQRVSVKITGVSLTGGNGYAYVYLKKPDNTTLNYDFVSSSGFVDTQTLSASGTYSVFVDPQGSNVGVATLTLYEVPPDVTGTITPGGAAVSVATTAPGQNARLTFQGTAGQRVSLKVTGLTITGGNGYAYVYLKKPDDTTLAYDFVSSSGFVDTQTLPANGTYSVFVDPVGTGVVGGMTLTLYDVPADISGPITPGGSAVTVSTTVPGQNARLTFEGTAGQRVSVKITGVSLTGGNGYAYVYLKKPDNTTLNYDFVSSGGFVDTQTLPANGTYSVLVDPVGTGVGSATLTLYDVPADFTDSRSINGSAAAVSITVPGQNGRLTFSANSGRQVTVRVTNNAVGYTTVRLLRPDGSQLTAAASTGSFNLASQTLSATGTYAVIIDPSGGNLGGLSVSVESPQSSMLRYFIEALLAVGGLTA
jgi:hypothetical protein